jgi:signal transduction histidine kinase
LADSRRSNAFEQQQLDSLFVGVNSLNNDSLKVIELNKLSDKYLKVRLDTAYVLVLKALDLSEKLENDYCLASSLHQLAWVLRYKGNYEKAFEYANQSYDLFEEMNHDSKKGAVLRLMGSISQRTGDYKRSVENFLESLKIYRDLNDSIRISRVLNNLGLLYTDMMEYEQSLDYLVQSLEIRNVLGQKDLIILSLMNIGNVYKGMQNSPIALDYYQQAIRLTDANTSKYTKALLLHNMGIVYQTSRQFEYAKQYYGHAVEIEEEIGEQDLYLSSMQGLGTMMIMQSENEKGLNYILKANNLAKEQGDLYKRKSLSKTLIWAYIILKDYKTSINYYDDYIAVNDSLMGLEKMKLVTQIEQKYEAEKRERQIAYLEKEKEIQDLEFIKQQNEAKQKRLQLNSLIVIVILAVLVLILLARDNKKRKTRNRLLIRQNKKIIDQRTEIVRRNQELVDSNQTKDKLLQIIAHDLRSPLVSIDSLTQLIPHWVEEQDYESLQKLSKTMEVSITNVLSLIDNLLNWALSQQGSFPYNPENFEVVSTLKDAINIYYPIADLKHINLKFKMSRESLVSADKNMFLTIIRNLLNNAIKFTPENGSVEVGVDYNDQFAKVWVEDSGVGIPDDKKEEIFKLASGSTRGTKGEVGKGLGLFFCKEFISINKGDVYIESAPEKGTKITFTLPLVNL